MAFKGGITMSVRNMGRLLGLKKTESYYLLNKHHFETITIAGKTRVVVESFEKWYAGQDRYKKIDGPGPGTALKAESLSFADIASMFGISTDSVRELIIRRGLPTFWQDNKLRVPRDEFDRWYASQSRYRNTEDREKDREAKEKSMTVPEMGRLLGLDSRAAWKLYTAAKDMLVLIRVADRPRITKVSFEKWYGSQSEYRIVPNEPVKTLLQEGTPKGVDLTKEYFTIAEAASVLDMDERDLYKMVSYREINGRKVGRHWFIRNEDLHQMLQTK